MKKFFFIVLLLTYGFSSSGITLQFHFCCGKLKSIAWSHDAEQGCDHNNYGSQPCCETKSFSIEEDKDYDKNPDFIIDANGPAEIHQQGLLKKTFPGYRPLPLSVFSPAQSSGDLFIIYCVYRI